MVYLILALSALIILSLTGSKSVHHEIMIDASPEKVWSVLTDTDNYDSWNPVMKLLEGTILEGNKVLYQFTQDAENISEIPSKVKTVKANNLLNQGGGMPFIITFDHRYILEEQGEKTNLIIHEDYKGLYVHFWNPMPVQEAYQRLNEAIKERVESL